MPNVVRQRNQQGPVFEKKIKIKIAQFRQNVERGTYATLTLWISKLYP